MVRPGQIAIEPTSACNLSCKYCPRDEYGKSVMTMDMFGKIVSAIKNELPGASVLPWLNGEPFLHPFYTEMITTLNAAGLRYYVTTNGTLDRPKIYDALLNDKSTAYQLIFSIDGIPDEFHKSIEIARPGTNREMLISNIKNAIAIKRSKHLALDIVVKLCDRGQDFDEIEQFIQYWLLMGIDYVCYGRALFGENEKSMRSSPCQWFDDKFMIIRSDGELIPCAYNPKSIAGKFELGYYKGGGSIVEAFNNEKYTALRNGQRSGNYHEICASCPYPYSGAGFDGFIEFRKGPLAGEKIYHRRDYYNSLFSLTDKRKEVSFYLK